MEKSQLLDTNVSQELKSIKQASFVKRILAFIMDAAVAVFTFFAFFFFVFSPIASKAFGYTSLVKEASDLQISSHLYVLVNEKDNRNTPIYNIDNKKVTYYTARIKYYYCTFKTKIAPDKNVKIELKDGTKVRPDQYYTESWFNDKFKDVDTVKEAKEASYDALVDFSKYLSSYQLKIRRIELFMILPSYALSFGIYFIMVPLLYKNGETFGKKILGIGFVSKNEYAVTKKQIVLRQLFIFFLTTLLAFFITIGFGSFIILGFGILVYYIAAFISKTHTSMADFIGVTYLIDTKNSVWFKDANQEAEKEKIVQENLEKYNKIEVENKNILQVGSEIVNEEAKQEYLENQKKKSKR